MSTPTPTPTATIATTTVAPTSILRKMTFERYLENKVENIEDVLEPLDLCNEKHVSACCPNCGENYEIIRLRELNKVMSATQRANIEASKHLANCDIAFSKMCWTCLSDKPCIDAVRSINKKRQHRVATRPRVGFSLTFPDTGAYRGFKTYDKKGLSNYWRAIANIMPYRAAEYKRELHMERIEREELLEMAVRLKQLRAKRLLQLQQENNLHCQQQSIMCF